MVKFTEPLRLEEICEDHLSQPSLLRAWPATAGHSGLCPVRFWTSPRMVTPQLLLATCSCVQSPPQQKVSSKYSRFRFMFQILPLVLSQDTTKANLPPSSLSPSSLNQVFIHTDKIPHEPSLIKSNSPFSLRLSMYTAVPTSLQFLAALLHPCLVLGNQGLDTALQAWPHQSWAEQKDYLVDLLQFRRLLAFFSRRAHHWLTVNLLSSRTPRSFSTNLLPNWSVPSPS